MIRRSRPLSGAAWLLICAAALLAAGCATTKNPKDPLEGYNRAMFKFNDGLDKAVIKPAAKGYQAAAPQPVRRGVTNFFSNVADVMTSVNDLLQGKGHQAANDAGRVLINSTVGLLGLFDVASEAGLEKHDQDFGQTLGHWGMGSGPYLVVPVLGPSDFRDGAGLVVDIYSDPVGYISKVPVRNSAIVLRTVNTRANLLSATNILEEAAIDRYAYVRDAYLQRRRNLIYDGNPPADENSSDEEDKGDGDAGAKPEAPAAAPQQK